MLDRSCKIGGSGTISKAILASAGEDLHLISMAHSCIKRWWSLVCEYYFQANASCSVSSFELQDVLRDWQWIGSLSASRMCCVTCKM